MVLLAPARVWALGEEHVGNEPLSPANYAKWPGLVEVVNDKARAYYSWVNGNENLYFVGSVEELNAALQNFAKAELKEHEVVVLPRAGTVKSFQADNQFTFQWHLQVFDGIAAHLLTLEKGEQVWPKHPRLTIHCGKEIDLAKLEIPKEVTLLSAADLNARARQGTASKDKSVRGWCAGVIAHLDARDPQNQSAIEGLLSDEDDWVRLNAAGAIPLFGAKAKSAIPILQKCLESKDENLKLSAQKAIDAIETAKDDAMVEREDAAAHERINRLIKDWRAANRRK